MGELRSIGSRDDRGLLAAQSDVVVEGDLPAVTWVYEVSPGCQDTPRTHEDRCREDSSGARRASSVRSLTRDPSVGDKVSWRSSAMRYRFRIIRTQTAERTIRASSEEGAMDVELLGVESSVETRSVGLDGGPLLLSVKDAAAHLGISRGLMYELLNRGDIESVRIGQRRLISREAINRFIETNSGTDSR